MASEGRDWQSELSEVVFEPGDFLFHEGDESFQFYVVLQGEIDVIKKDPDGQPAVLAIVTAGHSLGEFAMIDKQPRSASARARTRARATCISGEAYEHLLSELPEWAISVMRALVERLRKTNAIVRKSQANDVATIQQMDAIEFNSQITVIDESPFLLEPEEGAQPPPRKRA